MALPILGIRTVRCSVLRYRAVVTVVGGGVVGVGTPLGCGGSGHSFGRTARHATTRHGVVRSGVGGGRAGKCPRRAVRRSRDRARPGCHVHLVPAVVATAARLVGRVVRATHPVGRPTRSLPAVSGVGVAGDTARCGAGSGGLPAPRSTHGARPWSDPLSGDGQGRGRRCSATWGRGMRRCSGLGTGLPC